MSNIAIIPARSGSKGIKDKNIKDLCGKPLIVYTIESAFQSKVFDEIMVSTDSEVYAEVARQYGASVPFLRSEVNSSDTASSWDVVEEVLNNYDKNQRRFDTFCLLQPTSPLRTADNIKEAYELYRHKASFAVVSVCEAEHSPLWCGHLPDNCELDGFIEVESIRQRQTTDKFYRLNGAIYFVNVERFRSNRFLYQKGSYAYIMEQEQSVDIDTDNDFQLAELLLKRVKQ